MTAPRPETFVRTTDIVADLVLSRLGNSGVGLLDDLLTKLHQRLAVPGELTVTGTNKIVSVGETSVVIGPSNKRLSLPPLNGIDLGNRLGTMDFATGTGTGDVQSVTLPTMTPSFFIKAGFEVRENGNIVVVFGNEAATASAATIPSFSENAVALGYVVLQDDGAGAFTNVTYPNVYQVTVGAAGGGSEQSGAQDRNLKLVRGDVFSWNGSVLAWSADAFVQVPGLAENRNRIAAGNVTLASDGQVAYVEVNRTAGGLTNLTVQVSAINTLNDTPNTVVIARRLGANVLVGNGTILLKSGERLELDGALAEINRYFGQLKLSNHESALNKMRVSGADQSLLNGSVLGQEMKNLLVNFSGAVINFSSGAILKEDDATALGQNFTPFTVPAGHFFWYGVALIPSTVGSDGRIGGQILVTPASASNAVQANAPYPAIGGTKKLGAILVRNNAGNIEVVSYSQLGVGSGSGGSGTGNANDFYIELKKRLDDSNFGWVTSNIALDDADTLIDTGVSTATLDVANNLFKFGSIGAVLRSIQNYGDSFLGLNPLTLADGFRDHVQVELHAKWSVDDPLATYEVSRDGGLNWLALTMDRIGASKHYVGSGLFANPVSTEALIQYPTAVTPANIDFSNTLTKRAVKVVVTEKSKYLNFIFKYEKVGSPLGMISFDWVKDNAGSPSVNPVDIIGSSGLVSVAGLTAGSNQISVPCPAILPPGTYWMVMSTDATYQASYSAGTTVLRARADSAGTYVGGLSYEFNGTVWAATAGRQIIFENTGFRYGLLVRITGGTLDASLEGYGVFFGDEAGQLVPETDEPQYFRFSGNTDQTEFTLTNFWPNPKRVRATFVNAGLTFVHPFFDIVGNKLVFASGTFLYPGMDVILKVENTDLSGGANVDVANITSLLAENGLGSENATIDMSSPGIGPKLRRPDGTLRMLRLNNSDDIEVVSLP